MTTYAALNHVTTFCVWLTLLLLATATQRDLNTESTSQAARITEEVAQTPHSTDVISDAVKHVVTSTNTPSPVTALTSSATSIATELPQHVFEAMTTNTAASVTSRNAANSIYTAASVTSRTAANSINTAANVTSRTAANSINTAANVTSRNAANSINTAASDVGTTRAEDSGGRLQTPCETLCDSHCPCNCYFQHTSLHIVCSHWENNGDTLSQSNVNGKQIESRGSHSSMSNAETTTDTGRTDGTTRYDAVRTRYDAMTTRHDAVTHVHVVGINSSSDTTLTLLSKFKALKVVDIHEAIIDVTTTEATSKRRPLAAVKTLTLKNVSFRGENMTSIAEFLGSFESTQELTVTNCTVETVNVSVNSSRDELLSDNTSDDESSRCVVVTQAADSDASRYDLIDVMLGRRGHDNRGITWTNLKRLELPHNTITRINSLHCVADVTSRLHILNLSANRIARIERGNLEEFKTLLELDLSHNLIDSIGLDTLSCSLKTLQRLNLAGNRLHSVNVAALYPLQNLRQINLSSNSIRRLSEAVKVVNTSLTANQPHCVPRYNPVTGGGADESSVEFQLSQLHIWPHLARIDLSRNALRHVPRSLFTHFFKHSKYLSLARNGLTSLPADEMERLQRLEVIDVSHNDIDRLDVGTFSNPRLQSIDISHNRLQRLINMAFLYLPNLHRLNLSHNRLDHVSKSAFYKLCKFGQTVDVDCSHNQLTTEAAWTLMTSLVESVQNGSCGVDVKLHRNQLAYPLGRQVRKTLARAIRHADVTSLKKWAQLSVDVNQNPLQCDCQLQQDIDVIADVKKLMSLTLSNRSSNSSSSDGDGGGGDGSSIVRRRNSSISFVDGFLSADTAQCARPKHLRGLTGQQVRNILQKECKLGFVGRAHRQVDCDASSAAQYASSRCAAAAATTTHHIPLVLFGLLLGSLVLMLVMYALKRSPLVSKWLLHQYTNSRSHSAARHTITVYHHHSDTTLMQAELSYFLEECCPEYDVIPRVTSNINDVMIDAATQPLCQAQIHLFVVSDLFLQQMRTQTELENYYENIIDQDSTAILLFMSGKQELRSQFPLLWTRIENRSNLHCIVGEEKLQKLESLLGNVASGSSFCEHDT